ncbi:MAG TPA: orotate phosphoribosyltransferase [Ruminiclostridium sp.]|nr:orotate phosphoribosyltransferase [Clostridiaceae bacterium]HAA25297.1 orotate phosphoribosyltransferase [Ruminiclostridium sp.]
MPDIKEKLIEGLFETDAIKVCPAGKPFWYTSGKIGPYYVNTHFLYGGEEKANELLSIIDEAKNNKRECSGIILEYALKNYNEQAIYRTAIDALVESINEHAGINGLDYISGGERRDWFFSLVTAYLLKKPHITIFKDMEAYIFSGGTAKKVESIEGARVIHIADIITTASSFERAWVPAIRKISGNLEHSFVIVDRMQGGAETLKKLGVASHSLANIDAGVFRSAYEKKYINKDQYNVVCDYIKDPDAFMRNFFSENPDFIKKALSGDEKTAQRARLCIEKGYCVIK